MDDQQPLKKRLREEVLPGCKEMTLARLLLEHRQCQVLKFDVDRMQTMVENGKAIPIKHDGFRVRCLELGRFCAENVKVSCMTASVTPSYGYQNAAGKNFYFFTQKDEVVRGKLEAAMIRNLIPSVQRAWKMNENPSWIYFNDIPTAIILGWLCGAAAQDNMQLFVHAHSGLPRGMQYMPRPKSPLADSLLYYWHVQ